MTNPETTRELKKSVRQRLSQHRADMSAEELARQNRLIIHHALELLRARPQGPLRLAAYHAGASEPGGPELVEALREAGHDILLPLSGDNGVLRWARYQGEDSVAPGRLGIPEPTGESVSSVALADCEIIFVPALGVTSRGIRMGKGGGYYDRTLADLPDNGPLAVALLFDGEIDDSIPAEAHDFPVHAAITPKGLAHFPGN